MKTQTVLIKLMFLIVGVSTFTVNGRPGPVRSKFSLTQVSKSSLVADSNETQGGDATVSTSIFNLAKSIIGAGALSLPNGIAILADEPAALIPSSIICVLFGIAAAYSFSSIGKVCKETNSKTFQEIWEKSVNRNSAWIISTSITAMCFLASLAYSIIIGDSFTALAQVSKSYFS
jgi:amino acid permease